MLRFAGGLHIVGGPDRRRGRARHRARGPPAAPGHRRGLRARQRHRRASPAAVCAAAAATSSGSSRTASPSPARPGCSTAAAARCAACRRRWSPARRATPRPPGAARSSRTARSPSPAARPRWRSPAPARRPRWPWSAPRAGSASPPRRARCAASTASSSATATRSARMLTRLGAHDTVLAWEERRMRREVRATANRLANFDDANLRRSARAAVAAGARVERAFEILGDDVPEHLRAGRRAAPRAQAGEPRGARPARRPAADQGRRRRPDPPAARDGGQARRELGIPDTEASLTAGHARRRAPTEHDRGSALVTGVWRDARRAWVVPSHRTSGA